MDYWGYGPKPKRVKDGMRLQSEKISKKWWSDRWLFALESFGWKSRLDRGLNYARKGQVYNLEIKKGIVTAMVQGTKSRPYRVRMELKVFPDRVWDRVITVMGSSASYTAKLILGEMPPNIEEAFLSSGVELFPEEGGNLITQCSCLDSINPCKHIAAVNFVLAEEFGRNPLVIFHLRGRSRKEIMDELGKRRGISPKEKSINQEDKQEPKPDAGEEIKVEPLVKGISRFWEPGEGFKSFKVSIVPAKLNLALLKRLGLPVFCDREKHFWSLMKRVYGAAVEEAKVAALSDEEETKE